MATKIICPICDEEFGFSIDEVPDKCPVCDTRKHEIIQSVRDIEEASKKTPLIIGKESTKKFFTASVVVETPPAAVEEEVIVDDSLPSDDSEVMVDDSGFLDDVSPQDSVFEEEFEESAEVKMPDEQEVIPAQERSLEEEPVLPQEQEKETFLSDRESTDPGIVFPEETSGIEIKQRFDSSEAEMEPRDDVIFSDRGQSPASPEITSSPQEDVVFESQGDGSLEKKEPVASPDAGMRKSGASILETLPFGFKYCTVCGEVYEKEHASARCGCSAHPALTVIHRGFPPGHYLVLYNDQNKAIAYFRLDQKGSIFIGRSSERGSSRDIDLSIAWKNYYQKHQASPEDFKQKMGLLKGISRKHALVRYSEEDRKFVLFHLSDKNYTVVKAPDGEKRIRAPKNRSKIDLQQNCVLSFGNQREYITLRYKTIVLQVQSS